MSDRSAIEWTEATWNPTTGCDRLSSGCERRRSAGAATEKPARHSRRDTIRLDAHAQLHLLDLLHLLDIVQGALREQHRSDRTDVAGERQEQVLLWRAVTPAGSPRVRVGRTERRSPRQWAGASSCRSVQLGYGVGNVAPTTDAPARLAEPVDQ